MSALYAVIEREFDQVFTYFEGASLLQAARNRKSITDELEAEGYVLVDSGSMTVGWFEFYQKSEDDLGRSIHTVRVR